MLSILRTNKLTLGYPNNAYDIMEGIAYGLQLLVSYTVVCSPQSNAQCD